MSMGLLDYFSEITDPRIDRTKLHNLEYIGDLDTVAPLLVKYIDICL